MERIGRHLTYANAMATVAVFVALGSGAYAASTLSANSVGSRQLKSGAVTPSKVSKATIRLFKGQPGAAGPVGLAGTQGGQGPKGDTGPAGPGSTLATFLTPGSSSYTAPTGTTRLLVRLWGGGGAGGEGNTWGGGGGGGQGGYVEALVPVSGGTAFTVSVGAGGAGATYGQAGSPAPGQHTTFASTAGTLVTADGGTQGVTTSSCPNSGQPGGAGGSGSVTSPAQGILAIPGGTGQTGQSASGCGGGNGSGGHGAGTQSFLGVGGNATDAGVFTATQDGASGAAVIVAYVN